MTASGILADLVRRGHHVPLRWKTPQQGVHGYPTPPRPRNAKTGPFWRAHGGLK